MLFHLARLFKVSHLVFCTLCFLQTIAYGMEKNFYLLHSPNPKAIIDITSHKKTIHALILQSFRINSKGAVNGDLNEGVIELARHRSIKIIAMITNSYFDPHSVHLFLNDPIAQDTALNTLLTSCMQYHLYGVQFDFEMVPLSDRDALTQFYRKAAKLFHEHGFIVSFAVAPVLADSHFPSSYYEKLYRVWHGAYDLKALGNIADFVTVLSYDQHGENTIPGPVASVEWVEQVVKFILKFIPANKISLGIPSYSGLWYMDEIRPSKRITTIYNAIDYDTAHYIITKYHANLHWDNTAKINYTYFEYNHLNKFIFFENANSIKPKIALVNKYHLRGISVFRLGIEDPGIWRTIS